MDPARRALLRAGACGLGGSLAAGSVSAPAATDERFTPFDKHTRITVGNQGGRMLEKAYELGHRFEATHKGCCRCTVAALQKALDFVPDDPGLFRTATCLDGGATATGVHSCGGFTGSGIVIGYLCGGERFASAALAHTLVRKVAKTFQDEYGSVLCRDVRKKGGGCPKVVGRAARRAAAILLEQFTDYRPDG